MDDYLALLESVIEDAQKCLGCNYCYTRCPLDKSLEGFMASGPSGLIQSIYYALKWDLIADEARELTRLLYSCTGCQSCELYCKETNAAIPIHKIIEHGRKLLVEKGIGPPLNQREALKSLYLKGNPYNKSPWERLSWLHDPGVPKFPASTAAVLLYAGCSVSYDPDLNRIGGNIVKLLRALEIDFGLLEEEKCCGCLSKRLGDDFLFAEMAANNIAAFKIDSVNTLVTISPHCYNTFVHDYSDHGGIGDLDIYHYTVFIDQQIRERGFNRFKELNYRVTYHDPCYLGKQNEIYEEPRRLMAGIPGVTLLEMKDSGKDSLCCGAGGGRLWFELEEEQRTANMRILQALDCGADVIAVACPWCYKTLGDAIKDLDKGAQIQVKDISDLLVESILA